MGQNGLLLILHWKVLYCATGVSVEVRLLRFLMLLEVLLIWGLV